MRSDKQNQASRSNGKKSRGPVTDQGKANSARNADTHNLAATHFVLLSNEDPEEFEILASGYLQRFQPIDAVEYELVQKMIIASWRERRIGIMESSLFELEMERQRFTVDTEFSELGPGPRQVLALFGTTDAASASALLLRYAGSARRAFTSAYKILRDLQGDRFNRTGINTAATSSAQSPTSANTAEQPPAQQSTESERGETETAAAAKNHGDGTSATANAKLTIVRRHAIAPGFHREITKLQNEPKAAHPIARQGAESHSATFTAAAGSAIAAA